MCPHVEARRGISGTDRARASRLARGFDARASGAVAEQGADRSAHVPGKRSTANSPGAERRWQRKRLRGRAPIAAKRLRGRAPIAAKRLRGRAPIAAKRLRGRAAIAAKAPARQSADGSEAPAGRAPMAAKRLWAERRSCRRASGQGRRSWRSARAGSIAAERLCGQGAGARSAAT